MSTKILIFSPRIAANHRLVTVSRCLVIRDYHRAGIILFDLLQGFRKRLATTQDGAIVLAHVSGAFVVNDVCFCHFNLSLLRLAGFIAPIEVPRLQSGRINLLV